MGPWILLFLIKTIYPFSEGLLLPVGHLLMAYHTRKGTCIRVPTIINLVAFLFTKETKNRCFAIPLRFVLFFADLFAWSSKCWYNFVWMVSTLAALIQASTSMFK